MNIPTKKELREKIFQLLRNQREEDRFQKSLVIAHKLFKLEEFVKAAAILFYAPFDGEVDTFEMIKHAQKAGKKTALPMILRNRKLMVPALVRDLEKDLVLGPYGIKQPKEETAESLPVQAIDMVIVPGVAFDKQNHRLGRGGGYYDRFLGQLSSGMPTVGLAFDFQVIDDLPQRAQHDIPVWRVLSNCSTSQN